MNSYFQVYTYEVMGWFFESRILFLWHNIRDHFDIQTFLDQSEALVLTNLKTRYLAHLKKDFVFYGHEHAKILISHCQIWLSKVHV